MRPSISVAMCTFNGERYLGEQLDSVLQQDFGSFELIVVDDGSTDSTWSILQEYEKKDGRIRIFRNADRLGANANFARAFSLASAPLIAPSDQDDIWSTSKLSAMVEALGDSSAIYCDSEFVNADGSATGMKMSDRRRMYEGKDPAVFTIENCVPGHALLFRRELLDQAFPVFQGRFYDQWIAFVAASTNGICYLPRVLVRYRQHERTVTDLLGRREFSGKSKGLRRAEEYRQVLAWLWGLAHFESVHQEYFRALYTAYRARCTDYITLDAKILLWKKRKAICFIDCHSFWQQRTKMRRHSFSFARKARFDPDYRVDAASLTGPLT